MSELRIVTPPIKPINIMRRSGSRLQNEAETKVKGR